MVWCVKLGNVKQGYIEGIYINKSYLLCFLRIWLCILFLEFRVVVEIRCGIYEVDI